MDKKQTILITGSAGFIGFHLIKRLLEEGKDVIGVDNFNDYYDVSLKKNRNKILEAIPSFILEKGDLTDTGSDTFTGSGSDTFTGSGSGAFTGSGIGSILTTEVIFSFSFFFASFSVPILNSFIILFNFSPLVSSAFLGETNSTLSYFIIGGADL